MKQIFPFILIAAIVGAAMFFLNDSYEEEAVFDPISSYEEWSQSWKATFFTAEGTDEETLHIGVKLELEREDVDITALEFFFDTPQGGFFYQDLEIEDFDGTILYSELCTFCDDFPDGYINGSMMMNWKQNGEVRSEYFHFYFRMDSY